MYVQGVDLPEMRVLYALYTGDLKLRVVQRVVEQGREHAELFTVRVHAKRLVLLKQIEVISTLLVYQSVFKPCIIQSLMDAEVTLCNQQQKVIKNIFRLKFAITLLMMKKRTDHIINTVSK